MSVSMNLIGSLAEQEENLLSVLSTGITRDAVGSTIVIGSTDLLAGTLRGSSLLVNRSGDAFLQGTVNELEISRFNPGQSPLFTDLITISLANFSASGLYTVLERTDTTIRASFNQDFLESQFVDQDFFVNGSDENEAIAATVLFSFSGNDSINGFGGNDTLSGDAGNDTLIGGDGSDSISGGANFDTIFAGDGEDTVAGDNGRDLVYLNQGNDLYIDNAQGGELGRDTVFGGFGDDTIEGGNGDDVFYGEWGNDVINARLGDDLVFGGDQFDTISAGEGQDTVFGGNGRDLVFLNQGDDLYNDNGQGGELGQDTVFGGFGNDTIQGGNGDDQFYGEWGNDLIFARLGDDTVGGGAGNDTINGGGGSDTLTGAAGVDTFIFNAADAATGTDLVTDFELGVDVFQLAGASNAATRYDMGTNEVTVSVDGNAIAVLQSTDDLSGFGVDDIVFV